MSVLKFADFWYTFKSKANAF